MGGAKVVERNDALNVRNPDKKSVLRSARTAPVSSEPNFFTSQSDSARYSALVFFRCLSSPVLVMKRDIGAPAIRDDEPRSQAPPDFHVFAAVGAHGGVRLADRD